MAGAMSICRTQLPLLQGAGVALPSIRADSVPASSVVAFRRGSLPLKFPEQLTVNGTSRQARQGATRHRVARASASSTSVPTDEAKSTLKKLEGIKLYSPAGEEISLVGLWENRPAVVAFTRHFGCVLCKKRAALLESRKAEMDAAGVALVVIGPGSSEQAGEFVKQTKFSGEVYADPKHESYSALEFVKGAASVLNPQSASQVAAAYSEGYRQDWKLSFDSDTVQKGGWQQGGILVAGPGTGTVKYLFKDKHAGDEPELDEVMSACCA